MAHLKAAQNLGLTLTAICDRSEANRAKAASASDLAAAGLFDDAAVMLAAHRNAELVIIATTADSHRSLVELGGGIRCPPYPLREADGDVRRRL